MNNFYDVEEVSTINDIMKLISHKYTNDIAVIYREKGQVIHKTFQELNDDVESVALGLKELNLKDENIAVWGKNSYYWIISFLGIILSGNVAVPMDKDLSYRELGERIEQFDVSCIVYDKEYKNDVHKIKESLKNSKYCICMQRITDIEFCLLDVMKNNKSNKLSGNTPDMIAAIFFTSGTMDKSKGVMLTHLSIAKDTMCSCMSMKAKDGEKRSFLILPLHHAYGFTCNLLSAWFLGAAVCINSSIKYLSKEFQIYKPHSMVAVPLIIDEMYKNLWKEVDRQNKRRQLEFLIKFSDVLLAIGIDIRRKLFKNVLAGFGGCLEQIICGGAYMNPERVKQFRSLGINLLQGYGITECSPAISSNIDRRVKDDSVGMVYPYCKIKFVDGEIYVKGDIVMKGYYNNPTANESAFEDGWFKTGDLGYQDEAGYLYITGRKKNLIILKNGENINPEEIENLLYKLQVIKETIVYEDKDKITAEVFLDEEFLKKNNVIDINEYMRGQIECVNNQLPLYKKIGGFIIRDKEFEKTTSLKIKRY